MLQLPIIDREEDLVLPMGKQGLLIICQILLLVMTRRIYPIEKIIQGKLAGEGIKQTPAYHTPMEKEQLIRWREEFWETRIQGSVEIWMAIRSAIEEENNGKHFCFISGRHCGNDVGSSWSLSLQFLNDSLL